MVFGWNMALMIEPQDNNAQTCSEAWPSALMFGLFACTISSATTERQRASATTERQRDMVQPLRRVEPKDRSLENTDVRIVERIISPTTR